MAAAPDPALISFVKGDFFGRWTYHGCTCSLDIRNGKSLHLTEQKGLPNRQSGPTFLQSSRTPCQHSTSSIPMTDTTCSRRWIRLARYRTEQAVEFDPLWSAVRDHFCDERRQLSSSQPFRFVFEPRPFWACPRCGLLQAFRGPQCVLKNQPEKRCEKQPEKQYEDCLGGRDPGYCSHGPRWELATRWGSSFFQREARMASERMVLIVYGKG